MDQYLILLYFLPAGLLIAGSAMVVGRLIGFRTPDSKSKGAAYECGAVLFGDARIQFKVGYYLFALLFLVFDVESLFLFPVLRVFREVLKDGHALIVLADLGIFVGVLALGLAYAWKKGALEWD